MADTPGTGAESPAEFGSTRPRGLDGQELLAWMLAQAVRMESGCLEWARYRDARGYGKIRYRNRLWGAHRLVLHLSDRLPPGLNALHACDNPPCIELEHLWAGSLSDNSLDRERKGRGREQRGTTNPRSKVADADVVEIRALRRSGLLRREIAARIGCSIYIVDRVIYGDNWRHVA